MNEGTNRTAPEPSAHREPIVGIDLGTTNSLVAFADERGPRVLNGVDGENLLPSVVRYERAEDGSVRRVVGRQAKEEGVRFPRNTVASVKRLIGRSIDDAEHDRRYFSFELVRGEQDTARPRLVLGENDELTVTPQEVSAAVLSALKDRAEHALGTPVRQAVVTVPAYFDDAQRQATRDAGRLAGLEVVRIVNEPTAAALAYGIGLERDAARNAETRTVAVYDLGGGTFDVSILRLTPAEDEHGTSFYEVVATAGDTALGGDDVDYALIALFFAEINDRFGLELQGVQDLPAETRQALKRFAEGVKCALSDGEAASVRIELDVERVYERTVTRDELDALLTPWVERTLAACDRALRDAKAKTKRDGVDAVVLVGGSTRIPLVRRAVAERFGIEPYTALDPDRVVALGAAVQAGILSGAQTGSLLLDVIPLSLGIETAGGAVAKLILRNSAVPAKATEMFSTGVDGQTSIQLNVLQGEREMVEDCRSLGTFHLSGVPPMPAGIPQVEVEFLVDANGVLRVGAHERRSGKRASLQIVPNHGLTRDEVDRIEAESFEHAREDMLRHRVADLITNASLDLKWIGERLERHADALEVGYRDDLRARLDGLRSMVEQAKADWQSVDADELARAKQELDEASVRLQEVSIAASLRDEPQH